MPQQKLLVEAMPGLTVRTFVPVLTLVTLRVRLAGAPESDAFGGIFRVARTDENVCVKFSFGALAMPNQSPSPSVPMSGIAVWKGCCTPVKERSTVAPSWSETV